MADMKCPYPRKQWFLTRDDAVSGANRIHDEVVSRGDTFTALYPYRCPSGEHWHLSSKRQGRVECPGCRQRVPAWFNPQTREWVVYAHGECKTQAVVRR